MVSSGANMPVDASSLLCCAKSVLTSADAARAAADNPNAKMYLFIALI